MIRFDRTSTTVLALCACGWRQLTASQHAADQVALEHVHRGHPAPDVERARFIAAAAKRRQRDTP